VGQPDPTLPDALARAGGLKRWLRPLMNAVALAFVALTVRNMAMSWRGLTVKLAPLPLGVAAVPLLFSCLAQGVAWIFLIERMAHRPVQRGPALSVYLFSQLARYTPGKIGLPIVRMQGAARIGAPRSLIGISVLVEMMSWTATGAVVGFALLLLAAPSSGLGGLLGKLALPGFIAAGLGLLVLLWLDRGRYPAKVRALVAPDGSGPAVPLSLPLVQIGYWGLVALHGYLMSHALGASEDSSLTAMGFYVVSQVAGFVVLAAPAGLGVREAVIVAGLSPSVGPGGAAAAALISRVASLLAEVLVWATVRGATRGA
jgi:uncharacterized membrane protein YbhN (UPF0104 family)